MQLARNFQRELQNITEFWSPKVVGQVNDQYIKVARLKGEFVWHKHDDEDEMFHVIKGQLIIQFEDSAVELNEGDFYVVPKGVMHNPVAEQECWIVLLETVSTKHTGDVDSLLTKTIAQQLA